MAVDLSTLPTATLYAELRRRGWKPGRKAKVTTCPKCGALVTARELRRKCPEHSAVSRVSFNKLSPRCIE